MVSPVFGVSLALLFPNLNGNIRTHLGAKLTCLAFFFLALKNDPVALTVDLVAKAQESLRTNRRAKAAPLTPVF